MRPAIVTEIAIQSSQNADSKSDSGRTPQIQPVPGGFLTLGAALLWSGGAVSAFHLAYATPALALFTLPYVFCLLQLVRARNGRQSFYFGLGVGLLIAAPQLSCFWVLFGPSTIALWLILAFWTALFVTLGRSSLIKFGPLWGGLLLPFLWTGLEYFRSELYYLRFSWLNIGYAFSGSPLGSFPKLCGMYGVGFFIVAVAVAIWLAGLKRIAWLIVLIGVLCFFFWGPLAKSKGWKIVHLAGVQLEFPTEHDVLSALDKLIESKPETELIVLSEYTFDSPVPDSVKAWCKEHKRFLVAGGKDPAGQNNFYDTAFVVSTNGDVVFKQGKSVPVQFLKDGLPAREQKLWESPWGKIGICICYDLSYTRVTDRLVRLGAQALIVPTMDVVDWGKHEHELHARVARVRAAEYGIPIFRVASSGISQLVDRTGVEKASAGYPGQKEMLSGPMFVGRPGSLPVDRWLSPAAVGIAGLSILLLLARRILRL